MDASLKPMLCQAVDVVPAGPEWAIEGKLDGWRAIAHLAGRANVYGGRNGSSYSGKLPYIEDPLLAQLPTDTVLDGELVGGEWGDVQGVMTRGSGPHVPTNAIPALTYVVFDVIRFDGEDLRAKPWQERRNVLMAALAQPVPHVQLSPAGDASTDAHEKFVALGLEGSVCKRKESRYVNGRSPLWVKIKPQTSDEAKITGFKPGTKGSAFDGMVGAIEFKLANGVESRCSGFDMQTRRALTAAPETFVGRTIEVKHHGLTAEGKPRHPQFLRFRPDRDDLSPRQAQALGMMVQTAEPKETRQRQAQRAMAPAKRRMRNYGAMKDDKLLRCIRELADQSGDAYERCVKSGSGNPVADLSVATGIAQDRGLRA